MPISNIVDGESGLDVRTSLNEAIDKVNGVEAGADVTDAGNVGPAIGGATVITTIGDTDQIPVVQSNVLKSIAYSALKTLLSAIYQAKATILGTLGVLPNSAGYLKNDGAGVLSWATPSGGAVIAVRSAIKTDTQSLASSTWTDVTGLSITYSPTSSSNKILVVAQAQGGANTASCAVAYRLVRDSTAIGVADAAGSRVQASAVSYPVQSGLISTAAMAVFDEPATTSSTVYKLQFRRFYDTGSGTVYINRSDTDTDASNIARTASTITIYEVTP